MTARKSAAMPPSMEPRLVNQQAAAAYCGVSIAIFKREIRIQGIRLGTIIRYDLRDLDAWIDARKHDRPLTQDDYLSRFDDVANDHPHPRR